MSFALCPWLTANRLQLRAPGLHKVMINELFLKADEEDSINDKHLQNFDPKHRQ